MTRQVRGLVVVAGNPVVSGPDVTQIRGALSELELLVCIDFYVSETGRQADFILPPVSHLERAELDLVFPAFSVRNNVRYSPRAFEPPDGAQEDWDILLALTAEIPRAGLIRRALRTVLPRVKASWVTAGLVLMGPRGAWRRPLRGLTAGRVKRAPGGLDLGPLEPRLPAILRTSDRRVRLAPVELLAQAADLVAPASGSSGTTCSSSAVATCAATTPGSTGSRPWARASGAAPCSCTRTMRPPGASTTARS